MSTDTSFNPAAKAAPRRAALVVCALLSLAACGGINVVHKQKLELKPTGLPLRSFAFASGLRVIVEKDTRTPLAGVFVVVGSGSSSDPAGKEGLAHYVEHLAFQSRPFGKETFAELFDKAGSVQRNASTNWDATTYYEIGPSSALPEMLRTEAIRMVAPVSDITAASRAVELDVVRNELRERNETGFIGDVLAKMQAALFPAGHPYARPIGGNHQSVASLTKDDVDTFAKTHYRPDNMTLVLVGDLDIDKADQLLAQSLPERLVVAPKPVKLPERLPATPPAVPAPAPRPAELQRVQAAIASPEVWLGWTLPRGFDRDGYLLNFLASATRRRLSRARFDDRNIAGVDVFPIAGKEASMLLCRVSLNDAAGAEQSLKGVLEEVPKIVDQFAPEGVQTQSQFSHTEMAYSRARRGALVGELLEVQDLVGRGMRRASVTHLSQDPALLSKALHDLAELKAEKIHAYALPYLTLDRARAVLFVPTEGSAGGSETASGSATREGSAARLAAPPKQWGDELASASSQLTTYQLPNGLSVVLERRPGLPLITASLSFRVDAEAAKDGGARAFARALSFPAGNQNDPSEYGGHVWGAYHDDQVLEMVEASSGNAEAALATLAERARTMHLDPGAAVYFKEYVLPSYQRQEKEPHLLAQRAFFDALLPGNGYARVPRLEEVEAATPRTAGAWIDRIHAPANATLAVVGDFELTETQRWITESFASWKGAPLPAPGPAAAAPAKTDGGLAATQVLTTPRPGGSQGELRFGCQLPEVTSSAVAVRHQLAARVASARLWEVLRERLGATYGVRVQAVEQPGGAAYLDLAANVENGKLVPVLGELRKLLGELATTPVGAEELSWARYRRSSGVALGQMTNASVAEAIFARTRLGFSPDLAELRRDLGAVTAAEVQEDFQRCLGARPTLSVIGEEAVVQAALKEGWK